MQLSTYFFNRKRFSYLIDVDIPFINDKLLHSETKSGLEVGLTEIKAKFFAIKGNCKIVVSNHACLDHPNRKFSNLEIMNLVKYGNGQVKDNNFPSAIEGSFLYCPKDDQNEICELVLLIKELDIESENGTTTEIIIVCSAYRKDRA